MKWIVLVVALAVAPAGALAQECVGLPQGGRGLLAVGFEGTDGATGLGLSFAYQTPRGGVLLQQRSLEDWTIVDDLRTGEAQLNVRLPASSVPVCVTVGTQRSAYDTDRLESESWDGREPGYKTERHRLGGPYRRLRVPLGVSVGREFRLRTLSVTPFVAPAAVFERERIVPETGSEQRRSGWGWAMSGGFTAAVDWLVLRSSVSHTATHDYALSGKHNGPVLSVHAGVRF